MNNPISPIRTLVVDDDVSISRLICNMLRLRFGDALEVIETADDQTAFGLALANQFDLCISDLDMPTINGLKLLKVIKAIDPLTPFIMLTAHPNENAIRSAFQLGADDYLLKPIDSQALCNSVTFMGQRLQRFRSQFFSERIPCQSDFSRGAESNLTKT
jgi:DNA-binding response OmpR family regulator